MATFYHSAIQTSRPHHSARPHDARCRDCMGTAPRAALFLAFILHFLAVPGPVNYGLWQEDGGDAAAICNGVDSRLPWGRRGAREPGSGLLPIAPPHHPWSAPPPRAPLENTLTAEEQANGTKPARQERPPRPGVASETWSFLNVLGSVRTAAGLSSQSLRCCWRSPHLVGRPLERNSGARAPRGVCMSAARVCRQTDKRREHRI